MHVVQRRPQLHKNWCTVPAIICNRLLFIFFLRFEGYFQMHGDDPLRMPHKTLHYVVIINAFDWARLNCHKMHRMPSPFCHISDSLYVLLYTFPILNIYFPIVSGSICVLVRCRIRVLSFALGTESAINQN